ncbi:GAF domain-containing protein [Leptolyngbya ohadii]|uniref:GAF domain-containing protein n=1 Tax=Leptolyngbya ohadii TaxID=1962290 RepID=UPI001CEC2325|nr:GAF domain-containing protein [Leptolyngbya ohadii]
MGEASSESVELALRKPALSKTDDGSSASAGVRRGMGSLKEPSSYEKQLVALGRTVQSLREEKTVDGLIKIALEYFQAEFDYSLVWIGLYDRSEHRLIGKGGHLPKADAAVLKQKITLEPGDLLEQVVIQQRPIAVADLRQESRAGVWRSIAQKAGIQGTAIFPVRHQNQCLGVVILGAVLWGTSPHAEEKTRLSMVLGGLGEALFQIETEAQRRQAKRPDEPLLLLLSKLGSLPTLTKRLEAIVAETHRFVAPDRTNIYWYKREQRYFWRRTGNRVLTPGESADTKIAVQDINGFYQSLAADQLICIGEATSSFKADGTTRFMQQLQAQSIIAAPIRFQGELHGFLTVEGADPRIWLEEEKNYVRGIAQLIALAAPLEEMEETIQQVKQDHLLTVELSRALYSEEDWRNTLRSCAEQVCQRLKVERFLVLLHSGSPNEGREQFDICFQYQPKSRRPIPDPLMSLSPVDWQMLERSSEAIGIENLEDDLKLMSWRKSFLDLEVRSLLICNSAIGKPLEGLVLVAHESTRSWSHAERELLRVISQQIGLLLHQFQLQRQTDQLQKNVQTVQWGLTTMQQATDLEALEQATMEQVAQLLQVPLAALISWQPGRTMAKLSTAVVAKPGFRVATELPIPIYTDLLIQSALQNDGLLTLPIEDIPPETRQWLNGPEIEKLLVLTLRTAPDHEPSAIVLIGTESTARPWTESQLTALGTLMTQFGWCRRYLILTQTLLGQRQQLTCLNWYKVRRLEEVYRILNIALRRLNELSQSKDGTTGMRYQQTLRHLGNTLTSLTPVLKNERWQINQDYESIPLASLLKRSLERVNPIVKQRQLWSQVHNEASLSIEGDIAKIEFVLYEILSAACHRSPAGGRLDVWCRQVEDQWLELSITDHGAIEQRLLEELETGRLVDLLAPSTLDQPPGLHLYACQTLMQQLGGECKLYRLEDNRILSRLLIPIAICIPGTQINRSDGMSTFF